MSRVLPGLLAASLAVPAAIGLGTTDAAWAPVAQVSPASEDSDDADDEDDRKRKSSTERRTKNSEDIDLSKLSDEDVAALGMVAEALVVIAIASAI